jgi:hypothetical protein
MTDRDNQDGPPSFRVEDDRLFAQGFANPLEHDAYGTIRFSVKNLEIAHDAYFDVDAEGRAGREAQLRAILGGRVIERLSRTILLGTATVVGDRLSLLPSEGSVSDELLCERLSATIAAVREGDADPAAYWVPMRMNATLDYQPPLLTGLITAVEFGRLIEAIRRGGASEVQLDCHTDLWVENRGSDRQTWFSADGKVTGIITQLSWRERYDRQVNNAR